VRDRPSTPVDLTIARLAADQHRVVTWPQLLAAGLGRRSVAHRVALGRLYRIHQGVYLLEPPETATRLTLFAAAVRAYGRDALLSHRSAAELWGLLPPEPGDVDVTVVGRNPGKRSGIRRHRITALDPRDARTRTGLRVTAPARTALDLSPCLLAEHLEGLVAAARVERLATDRQIVDTLGRCPTHPGVAALKAVLRTAGGPSLTRSRAERRLLELVRQAGLSVPVTNARTGAYEVDFLWQEARLAVEVDGYAFHGDRAAFERDRRRDAALLSAGWRVMRFTWRQIVEEPLLVVGRIAQMLGPAEPGAALR
jgi:very-short-patch-repair endonuclease